ncbi:RteC domain-containing protein [Elizabethkingia anophelis]|uniref:RteC domain-containing protein n=1 Tax=Elizabethkingia anophelis TaxID=1117645 RepID=UPI00378700CC
MTGYYFKALEELEDGIDELTIELDNSLPLYEKIIELILSKISIIKKHTLRYGFKSKDEEINFFKKIKPLFTSKLIYYNNIYKVETRKPYGGEKTIKKYLNAELSRIKKYFDNNLEFYRYYRTNSTYLDQKYFLRKNHDIKLNLDTYYFESDYSFSTSHDYKVSKIIANDLLQVYLEGQLNNMQNDNRKDTLLNWSGTKTALIELIYALHANAIIDNGNADIKLIAQTFGQVFDIELGDIYHTYLELRSRKINRTKFLDTLREGLIKKMDEQEER